MLPTCSPESATVPPPRTTPAPPAGSRIEVLVADDDDLVCRSIARILKNEGFGVRTVTDGSAVIEALRERSFDVILSDICMPETSGTDLLRLLQAYDVKIPVLLMTGQPGVESATEAVELGAVHYLRKPIAPADLKRAIEATVRGGRASPIPISNGPTVAAPPSPDPNDSDDLAARVDRAIASLWLAYQPIVSVRSSRVVAYQALLRSAEPTFRSSGELGVAARRVGREIDLGRAVRVEVAAALEEGPQRPLMVLDLWPHDLLDPELASEGGVLAPHARRVVFAINQSPEFEALSDLEARVHILKFMGYRIAVDDLGAGASGLGSLSRLEPDFARVDSGLVRDIQTSVVRKRVLQTMMDLCDELDINVIASEVELPEERDTLRQIGCDLMQGSFFAKPEKKFPLLAWT